VESGLRGVSHGTPIEYLTSSVLGDVKETVMLATKQKVLRRFWYPVIPVEQLKDGPKPFKLLGEDIVVWLDAAGKPAATIDRCCHRTAKLSCGFVEAGNIVCGYHGWTFDAAGKCVRVPQAKDPTRKVNFKIDAYRAELRYGYVWVALDEPLAGIPEFAEADDPAFRRVPQFYEVWKCSGLRLMENSFDASHQAYVHRGTFGDIQKPQPFDWDLEETEFGFRATGRSEVVNRDTANKVLQMEDGRTTRTRQNAWWMPFTRRLGITYPNGLKHIMFTSATPIDDDYSMIVQFVFRNDTEEQVPAADIVAFDRKVTFEDKFILESTDPDVPLDGAGELNMPSDKPGLIMRRRMRALLQAHGEVEMRRSGPVADGPGTIAVAV
jgi:phenylpropionate dioxygenase-like ring-hydroxylating dioxygenase large terminal subunit